MSQRVVAFPAELCAEVDFLVQSAHAGVREPAGPAFDLVTSWCEVHDDQSGIQSGEYGTAFVVVPRDATPLGCSDEDLQESLGLDIAEVTDDARLSFLRERLHELLESTTGDGDEYPMACLIRLRGTSGLRAALCYLTSGGGYGHDPDIEWLGVYRTVRECRTELRKRGYFTESRDVDRVKNEDLLKIWPRPSLES